MLNIALAQINPTIGEMGGNIAQMRQAAHVAHAQGAKLVVFPELSLTGHHPGDLLADSAFRTRVRTGLEALLVASREVPELHWAVGAPVPAPGSDRLHNALLVVRNGTILLSYAQHAPVQSSLADERRHFEAGVGNACILRVHDTRIAFVLAEDLFAADNERTPSPMQRISYANPDLVVAAYARPTALGAHEMLLARVRAACTAHGLPLVLVNQVGGHDDWVYEGGSFALSAKGKVAAQLAHFEDDLKCVGFDTASRDFVGPNGGPLPGEDAVRILPRLEFYRRHLVLGIRDYARRCGFTRAVVGSSGGIDSALVLTLAVQALGAENVAALTMPSAFSSAGSIEDSATLCANLGVELEQYPIAGLVDAFVTQMGAGTRKPHIAGLALENLQARLRGTQLMAYSNLYGHLVLATGNKSEASVGYCTLYGDTVGGLAPIADLYKTEVFALSEHLNAQAGRELIPRAILDKPPSAELAPGQRDTDSLPPYDVLDDVLRVLNEGERLEGEEAHRAFERITGLEQTEEGRALIAKVRRLRASSEYKRRQSPPVLRVRPPAFNTGLRPPIAAMR